MKIINIKIENFRKASNLEIKFKPNLNAIAGQNGTIKTSLLGLIGHIFNFDNSYKTLSGKNFSTDFSEIFKFAYPDYDKPGNHKWRIFFNDGTSIQALSYDRIEMGKQKSIRIRVGKSAKGEGKKEFPVIYLGMGRLFPLTLDENILNNSSDLSEEEILYYKDVHNDILMIDDDIIPENITATNKRFYAPKTKEYNHLGNSAGQDNLGQIITAILSFKRLQKELDREYLGGILLIDEIDASLFPAAQIKLIDYLFKVSLQLNLQIFFTTHSLEVLEKVNLLTDSKIIFLNKNYGQIQVEYNMNFSEIRENLLVLGPDAFKIKQKLKYLYCEDDEASDMIKNILTKEESKKLDIFSTKLGEKNLKDLAKKNIPDFKNSIIVLDGDVSVSKIKNVLYLPGSFGPDRLMFNFLKSLDASDPFWSKKKGYNKQFCFKNLSNLNNNLDKSKLREKIKKWYKEQKQYWGRNGNKAWKYWLEKNKEECINFNKKIQKLLT